MKISFRFIVWITLVLLVTVGSFDTALAQTIAVSPTSLVFCVPATNSPAPLPQTLTVSATGATQNFNASATQTWIRLNGNVTPPAISGNTQFSPGITVQIDTSAYAAGSNTGIIQVTASPTIVQVPVAVNVNPSCSSTGGTLTANPTSINLTPTTVSQGLTIGGASGNVTASFNFGNGPSGWFGLNQTSGALPLLVTVSLSSAPAGVTYGGSVTFTLNGTSNTVTVPVNYVSGGTGNGAFTASPPSISQTFATNSSAPVDAVITVGAGFVTGVNITTSISLNGGPAGWLTSAGSGAVVPTNVTVHIDPTNLVPGVTYTGFVTFSQTTNSGNFVTVPISAIVNGSSSYSASPNPVTFSIPTGTIGSVQQVTTVFGPNVSVVMNPQAGNGPIGWFTVTPSSGTIPSSGLPLTVTVPNPSSLTAGTYNGSIVVTQGGNTVLTIQVNAVIGGSSALTVTPPQLNFAWQTGTSNPAPQSINVSSAAGTVVFFSATATTSNCGSSWIVLNQTNFATNGTAPVPVTVSINTAALPSGTGTCSANIAISSSGNATVNIPVTLLVSTSPILNVSPGSVSFTFQPGGATPQSQNVQLTSSNSGTQLNFSANVSAVSGSPVFATVNSGSTLTGTTPFTLTVGVNTSALNLLGPGTYTNNVVITSNAGNPTVTLPVTLTVSGNASLQANPTSLTLNYQIGQPTQPPTQVVTISSTAGAIQFNTLATATNCGNFLSVSPPSGTTSPGLGLNSAQIAVSANFTGITVTAGTTCSGNITVSAVNSSTTVTIPVTVNIVNTPVIDIGVSSVLKISDGTSVTFSTVPLTASDGATSIPFNAFVATIPPGLGWVAVTPQTGFTPTNLNVQFAPNGFPAGTYNATLTVTDTRASTAIQTQTIPITMIVAVAATATPSSLTFSLPQGGTAPNQTITVGNVPSGATIGASPSYFSCLGTNWINTSVSGNVVTVGIVGAGLTAPSQCTGQVSIIVPGASNSPLNVPVTVNVTNPVTLTLTSSAVNFTFAAGAPLPAAQTVQLSTSNATVVPYSISVTSPNGNFFTVTPATANTPQALTIALNPTVVATLAPGTYSGAATISSNSLPSVTMSVTLTITAPPPPVISTVFNSATLQAGPISPGEIISIFGTNVGPVTAVSLTLVAGKVSTNIGNTQVFFDGIAAPLIYVSATQINAIVPYELAGRLQTTMTVVRGGGTGGSSNSLQLGVTGTAPGIFTLTQNGSGQGAILNQNGTVNGAGTPAPKGTVISIYATGEGQINPPGVTGSVTTSTPPFPAPVANVSLAFLVPGPNNTTVSVPATLTYAGEAPSLVSGVLQVNAVVPATVPSGTNTIVLTVGANSSPSVVTVQVQ